MKNKIKFLAALLVSINLFWTSCKKDHDEPDPPKPVSYLCTGLGSTSYYPLAINNEWSYPGFFGNSKNNFIRNTKTFGLNTYFEIGNNYGGYIYLRQDTSGDIIIGNTSGTNERVFLPNSPILNQTWQFPDGSTSKITSVSADATTPNCTYTNCLKIQDNDQDGNTTTVSYYKRGLGLVKYTTFPPPGLGSPIDYGLESVILN